MVHGEREHQFDAIHVVEFLRKGDRRTGQELMRNVIEKQAFLHNGLQTQLHQPDTKESMLATLTVITEQCRKRKSYPILHIESHGSPNGIGLINSEMITWHELKDLLTELNIVSKMNLFVVLAACHGQHLVKLIRPTSRAPLWGLIGPKRDLYDIDLLKGFSAFYQELLVSLDGEKATRVMNSVFPAEDDLFRFFSAEKIFCEGYSNYIHTNCSTEALQQREDAMILKRRQNGPLSKALEKGLRTELREKLTQQQDNFQRIKRHFFLLDLFPQNASRFPVSLCDCSRIGD